MIITCPSCSTRFNVKAEAFSKPRKVRCAKCGEEWMQEPEGEAPVLEEAIISDEPPAAEDAPPPPPPEPEPEPAPKRRARESSAFAGAQKKRSRGGSAGWIALAVFVLMVIGSFLAFRGNIVQMWPASERLYAAIGMPIEDAAMEFENVVYSSDETQNGLPVLSVRGHIVNVSHDTMPVPRVRVSLRDRSQRELYAYSFAVPETELGPGGKAEFVTRLSSPPANAHDLVLRFMEPGETIEGADAPAEGSLPDDGQADDGHADAGRAPADH